MRNQRGGVVQAIPSDVFPGVCSQCHRERTLCAAVTFKGNEESSVVCSQCRISWEGFWTVPPDPVRHDAKEPEDDPRVRQLGRGLRARSPSKHSMPFNF